VSGKTVNRKISCPVLVSLLLALSVSARAQQPKKQPERTKREEYLGFIPRFSLSFPEASVTTSAKPGSAPEAGARSRAAPAEAMMKDGAWSVGADFQRRAGTPAHPP
jgi:hypothetical protein